MEAVTAKLLKQRARYGKGDHGLCGDACRWYDANVRALIGCLSRLASFEGHGSEGAAEGGDGLEVASDDKVFAVGDAAFEASGVVVLTGEAREVAYVAAGVGDGVVDLGAGGLGGGDASA